MLFFSCVYINVLLSVSSGRTNFTSCLDMRLIYSPSQLPVNEACVTSRGEPSSDLAVQMLGESTSRGPSRYHIAVRAPLSAHRCCASALHAARHEGSYYHARRPRGCGCIMQTRTFVVSREATVDRVPYAVDRPRCSHNVMTECGMSIFERPKPCIVAKFAVRQSYDALCAVVKPRFVVYRAHQGVKVTCELVIAAARGPRISITPPVTRTPIASQRLAVCKSSNLLLV